MLKRVQGMMGRVICNTLFDIKIVKAHKNGLLKSSEIQTVTNGGINVCEGYFRIETGYTCYLKRYINDDMADYIILLNPTEKKQKYWYRVDFANEVKSQRHPNVYNFEYIESNHEIAELEIL